MEGTFSRRNRAWNSRRRIRNSARAGLVSMRSSRAASRLAGLLGIDIGKLILESVERSHRYAPPRAPSGHFLQE